MNSADKTFHLVISSVGQMHFDGAALSATLPGAAGEMTVLPHHEALVSILRKGKILVRTSADGSEEFDIESGVLEVSNNRAVVLL